MVNSDLKLPALANRPGKKPELERLNQPVAWYLVIPVYSPPTAQAHGALQSQACSPSLSPWSPGLPLGATIGFKFDVGYKCQRHPAPFTRAPAQTEASGGCSAPRCVDLPRRPPRRRRRPPPRPPRCRPPPAWTLPPSPLRPSQGFYRFFSRVFTAFWGSPAFFFHPASSVRDHKNISELLPSNI